MRARGFAGDLACLARLWAGASRWRSTMHGGAVDRSADERPHDHERGAGDRGLHRDAHVSGRHDEGRHRRFDVLVQQPRRHFTHAHADDERRRQVHGHRRLHRQAGQCAGDRALERHPGRSDAAAEHDRLVQRHRRSDARTERRVSAGRRRDAAQPRRLRDRTGPTRTATTSSRSRCTPISPTSASTSPAATAMRPRARWRRGPRSSPTSGWRRSATSRPSRIRSAASRARTPAPGSARAARGW